MSPGRERCGGGGSEGERGLAGGFGGAVFGAGTGSEWGRSSFSGIGAWLGAIDAMFGNEAH